MSWTLGATRMSIVPSASFEAGKLVGTLSQQLSTVGVRNSARQQSSERAVIPREQPALVIFSIKSKFISGR